MFISFDLDDTLLRKDKSVSDYSLKVLNTLKELGHIIIINTARSLQATEKLISLINPNFTVVNAGSLIIDDKRNVIYSDPISKVVTNGIVKELLNYTNTISIQTFDVLYTTNKDYKNPNAVFYDKKDYFLDAYKILPCKLDAIKALEIIKKYDVNYTSYFGGDWSRFSKNPNDKLHGLEVVVSYCQGNMNDTISFGDDYGDLPMIKGSFVGVAMSNALDDVLKESKYICDSCDNDGVAKFLEKYFKLEV